MLMICATVKLTLYREHDKSKNVANGRTLKLSECADNSTKVTPPLHRGIIHYYWANIMSLADTSAPRLAIFLPIYISKIVDLFDVPLVIYLHV